MFQSLLDIVVGLFVSWVGSLLPYYGPMILGRRVRTSLTETHLRLACAQVKALEGILSMLCAYGKKYYYKTLYRKKTKHQDS